MPKLESKQVTAYTATSPILVNGEDINKGLYPVLNFKPVGAQYPYIYVPIAEFRRVGAMVEWDPDKEVINVTSDYEQLKTELADLQAENKRLSDIVNSLGQTVQKRDDRIVSSRSNSYGLQSQQAYKPVIAQTATSPILVNGVDINTGLYPVLNYKPVSAQYPFIYVPIAEFSRVGAKVAWDPDKEVISVTSDYQQIYNEVTRLKAENERLRNIISSQPQPTPRGNTAGNLVNWGLAAGQDDWVYFCNIYDNRRLYKMKLDGTGSAKLSDDAVLSINVLGDWIYYISSGDKMEIFRIKTDGTGRSRIGSHTGISLISVVGDWIYYSSPNEGSICKIHLDGTGLTPLGELSSGRNINVVDDWIYCNLDAEGYKIYKIRTDGTEKTKVTDDKSTTINVYDGWIYYDNWSDVGCLYKIKTDGTEKTKLLDHSASNINVTRDWIYYGYTGLYKMRPDVTEITLLEDRYFLRLPNVIDGWVFFETVQSGGGLYKIKTDGTEGKLIMIKL